MPNINIPDSVAKEILAIYSNRKVSELNIETLDFYRELVTLVGEETPSPKDNVFVETVVQSKVEWVKTYRALTGASLKEAVDAANSQGEGQWNTVKIPASIIKKDPKAYGCPELDSPCTVWAFGVKIGHATYYVESLCANLHTALEKV
jgi:ribosomal protein L7/L12